MLEPQKLRPLRPETEPYCRICKEAYGYGEEPLISPCGCTDTQVQRVHNYCLWVTRDRAERIRENRVAIILQ